MKTIRDFTSTAALVMVLAALAPAASNAQAVEIVKVDVTAVGQR